MGEELFTRLTVCSIYNTSICVLTYFPFRCEGKISVFVVQVYFFLIQYPAGYRKYNVVWKDSKNHEFYQLNTVVLTPFAKSCSQCCLRLFIDKNVCGLVCFNDKIK